MRGFIEIHRLDTGKPILVKVGKIQSVVDYGDEGRTITTENGQDFDCRETMIELQEKMMIAQGY